MAAYIITFTDKKTGRRGTMNIIYKTKREAQKSLKVLQEIPSKHLKSNNHRLKKVL